MTEEQIKQKAKENSITYSNDNPLEYECGFINGYHECQKEHEWHYNDYPETNKEVICKDYVDTNFIAYYDGEDWVTQDDKIVTCVARWKEIE